MTNKLSFVVGTTKVDNVYEFDDQETVLSKYCLIIYRKDPETLQTSPRFLRFTIPPKKFEDGANYPILNIRDQISKLSLIDLTDRETLSRLKLEFPKIDTRDIVVLWLEVNGYDKMTTKDFTKEYEAKAMKPYFLDLSRQLFPTPILIKRQLSTYISTVIPAEIDRIAKIIERETKIYEEFRKIKTVTQTSEFNLERTTEEHFLHLPDGESLYDVFNAIKTTQEVPFILLVDNDHNKKYYKVFDGILPPDEWIFREVNDTLNRSIYFYVIDSSVNSVYHYTDLQKSYNQGVWKPGNSVELEVKNNIVQQTPMKSLLSTLEDRIKYQYVNKLDMGVKGVFLLLNQTLNPIVMADLIALNPIFKYFLFFNEQKKGALMKKRFSFYYQPNQNGKYEDAITVTITQNNSDIEVRLSRVLDLDHVERFKVIFKFLWGIYLLNHEKIVNKYKNMYKGAVFNLKTVSQNKKENKKTGSLLLALQSNTNPDSEAFLGGGYSEKCQANQQPYLIPPENLSEVQKALKPQYGKHGIIEWPRKSGNMYACDPRAGFDINKHGWPGLVPTEPLKSSYEHLKKYPYKPCCFTVDQYDKKSSGYNKYITGASDEKKKQSTDRPLGESKEAPPGRTAELPYFLQLVANSSGYKKTDTLRKEILPILRLGVISGPTSFVHCLEQALNPKYTKSSDDQKIKMIQKVLNGASTQNFSVARQELFGISTEIIKDHLSDDTAYIDPDYYVSVFEKFYSVNIILFKVDNLSPNGDIVIPRHSIVYLDKKLNSNRKTVIIIKREVPFDWKYQSELVVKYTTTGNIEYAFQSDDPFVSLISKIKYETNKVYITSPAGSYKKYEPVSY